MTFYPGSPSGTTRDLLFCGVNFNLENFHIIDKSKIGGVLHFSKRNAVLTKEIEQLQASEAELMRKMESGSQASKAATEIIPATQHILDHYSILTVAEKNQLWKLILQKATVYRTPDGELSVHIYPNLPR